LRGDKSLDLWCFEVWFGAFLLGCHFSFNDKLPNIILLGKTEESSDLGSSLWTQSLRHDNIGQAWDILFTLFDDGEGKDSKVLSDNTATNRLSLALSSSSWPVAGVAIGEEEFDSGREHDTLFHRKALLVITTRDAEDVTLPFITKTVS